MEQGRCDGRFDTRLHELRQAIVQSWIVVDDYGGTLLGRPPARSLAKPERCSAVVGRPRAEVFDEQLSPLVKPSHRAVAAPQRLLPYAQNHAQRLVRVSFRPHIRAGRADDPQPGLAEGYCEKVRSRVDSPDFAGRRGSLSRRSAFQVVFDVRDYRAYGHLPLTLDQG